MAERLRINAADLNGVKTVIKVYVASYAGSVVERDAVLNYLEITWGDQGENYLPTVYGASASVTFFAEQSYELADVYRSNPRDVIVLIEKAGTVIFRGFLEQENYVEPYDTPPFEVRFSAFCGLGSLDDEPFEDAGDVFREEMTPLKILSICLKRTGHSLPINTIVAMRENYMPTNIDPLTGCIINTLAYEGMTCREVLDNLLAYCRIMQRNGEWWVISQDAWAKGGGTYYRYNAEAGAVGTGTVNFDTTHNWWFEGYSGNIELLPPMKFVDIEQDYGLRDNLLLNGDFSGLVFDDGLQGWTPVNVNAYTERYDDKGNRCLLIRAMGTFEERHERYVVSDAIRVYETPFDFKITAKYAFLASGGIANGGIFLRVKYTTDSGAIYWLSLVLNDKKELEYRWSPDSADLYMKPEVGKSRYEIGGPYHYFIKYGISNGRSKSEAYGSFESFEAICTHGLQENGFIEIFLHSAHLIDTVSGQVRPVLGVAWTDVAVGIIQDDDVSTEARFATGTTIRLYLDEKNIDTPDEIKLVNGDLPNIPGARTSYLGGFILPDGTNTNNWIVDGLTGNWGYAEMVGRLMYSTARLVREAYNCTFADLMPGMGMVITDGANSNRKFIEAGITYNDSNATTTGRYVEIVPDDLTVFAARKTETNGSSSGGSGGGGGNSGNYIGGRNTDEMVGFIDPDIHQVVFGPGYLNADYFEPIVDYDEATDVGTGRVAIIPSVLLIDQNFDPDRIVPQALGNNSVATGEGTVSESFREVIVGSYNALKNPGEYGKTAWVNTDLLFAVANGVSANSRHNTFEIYKSGYVINGNAIAISEFYHPGQTPWEGSLQFTAAKFQGYANEIWRDFAFADEITNKYIHLLDTPADYDAVGKALVTTSNSIHHACSFGGDDNKHWVRNACGNAPNMTTELAVNHQFVDDLSGWTNTGWNWFNGAAKNNAANTLPLSQSITRQGQTRVSIYITGQTAGTVTVTITGAVEAYLLTQPGVYELYFTATAYTWTLAITPTTDFDGTIEYCSVRGVIINSQAAVMVGYDESYQETTPFELRFFPNNNSLYIGKNAGSNHGNADNVTVFGAGAGAMVNSLQKALILGAGAGATLKSGANVILIDADCGAHEVDLFKLSNLLVGNLQSGDLAIRNNLMLFKDDAQRKIEWTSVINSDYAGAALIIDPDNVHKYIYTPFALPKSLWAGATAETLTSKLLKINSDKTTEYIDIPTGSGLDLSHVTEGRHLRKSGTGVMPSIMRENASGAIGIGIVPQAAQRFRIQGTFEAPGQNSAMFYLGGMIYGPYTDLQTYTNQAVLRSDVNNATSRGFLSIPQMNVPAGLTASWFQNFFCRVDINGESAGGLTNAAGLYVSAPSLVSTDTYPVNIYGIRIQNQGHTNILNAYGLYINQQTGTNAFNIYSDGGRNFFGGLVGIGTTAPAEKLHIVGNARVDDPAMAIIRLISTTLTREGRIQADANNLAIQANGCGFYANMSTASCGVMLNNNRLYYFPTTRGTSGQVLTTYGNGATGWTTVVGGGGGGETYWIEDSYGIGYGSNVGIGTSSTANSRLFVDGGTNGTAINAEATGYAAYLTGSVAGVFAHSPVGVGVYGNSTTGSGVEGFSNSGSGIVGMSISGYAGAFSGGLGLKTSRFEIGTMVFPTADGAAGQILSTNGAGVLSWITPTGGGGGEMIYPPAGIPVSTGTAWGTSKAAPVGAIVGTTDAQLLTNKTVNGVVLSTVQTASTYLSGAGTYVALPPGTLWEPISNGIRPKNGGHIGIGVLTASSPLTIKVSSPVFAAEIENSGGTALYCKTEIAVSYAAIFDGGKGIRTEGYSVGSGNNLIIDNLGYIKPISQANHINARNNTIFFSETNGKLVYRDASGVVHNLH